MDRRRFKSDAELADYLVNMGEVEYLGFRNAALEYLESERFERFLPGAFAETVLAALGIGEPVSDEAPRGPM